MVGRRRRRQYQLRAPFVSALKGYRHRIVTNDAVAIEKRRAMEIFGATSGVLKSGGANLAPESAPRMMVRAREIAAEGPSCVTDEMRNPDMVAGYEWPGEELLQQVDGDIDAFCASGGTTAMLVGGRARAEGWRYGLRRSPDLP